MGAVGVRVKHLLVGRFVGFGAFALGYFDCACGWSFWGLRRACERAGDRHLDAMPV